MWRSGASQRRGARAAPQGRRCTYEQLCDVKPEVTREYPTRRDGLISNGVKLESKYPQQYQGSALHYHNNQNRCSSSGYGTESSGYRKGAVLEGFVKPPGQRASQPHRVSLPSTLFKAWRNIA